MRKKTEPSRWGERADIFSESPGGQQTFRPPAPYLLYVTMDAIKKKMQAKEAKIRAAKVEEEVADLVKKAQQLEVELDKTKEELMATTQRLEEKERVVLEVSSLNRRIQALEGDLETCEDNLLLAT